MKKKKKVKLIKYKYFIKFDGVYYELTDLYKRKLKKSIKFVTLYDFIREYKIPLEDVYIQIKTLKDFGNYATFEERSRI